MGHGPDQQRLDFNPIEATPEERERIRRIALEWTREEAEEDFTRLPGEYLRERDLYVSSVVVFGGEMPKEPSVVDGAGEISITTYIGDSRNYNSMNQNLNCSVACPHFHHG